MQQRHITIWSSLIACLLFASNAIAQTTPTPTYIIQSTVTGGGFVDPSAAVIDQGSGKIFKFIPAAGNIVSDVKLDGTSVISNVTISSSTGYGTYKLENVSATHTLAVTFITDPTPPSTISTSFTGNGAVEPAVYELKNGKTKNFKFTALPGHILSNVTLDGASILSNVKLTNDGEKGSYTMNYATGNHALVATFIADPTPPITVTATATGTGIVEPATAEIKAEKSKSFKFTAATGSIISDVTLDGVSVLNDVKLTNEGANGSYKMNYAAGNHAIVATFVTDPTPASTVTVTSTGSGAVEPATYVLKETKSKSFKFTATPGNVVSAVTVNGTNVMPAVKLTKAGEVGTLKLDYSAGNKTIAVTFAADPTPDCAVTSSWTGNGIVDPAQFTLKEGKTKTVTIIPVTGYQIQSVTLNGTNVTSQVNTTTSGKGTLPIDYATSNQALVVTFTAKQ